MHIYVMFPQYARAACAFCVRIKYMLKIAFSILVLIACNFSLKMDGEFDAAVYNIYLVQI